MKRHILWNTFLLLSWVLLTLYELRILFRAREYAKECKCCTSSNIPCSPFLDQSVNLDIDSTRRMTLQILESAMRGNQSSVSISACTCKGFKKQSGVTKLKFTPTIPWWVFLLIFCSICVCVKTFMNTFLTYVYLITHHKSKKHYFPQGSNFVSITRKSTSDGYYVCTCASIHMQPPTPISCTYLIFGYYNT